MKRTRVKRAGPLRPRKGRFGNVPHEHGGRVYASKLERDHAAQLDLLRHVIGPDRDRVASWTPQVSVKLEVNGSLVCRYIVDFHVIYADGHEEWHETKGFTTDKAAIKMKLFRALFPDRNLVIVKKVKR